MSDVDQKLTVLVIGSLGELVKKIIELDMTIHEDYKAKSVYAESLALQRILNEWPVLNEEIVFLLTKSMRHSMEQYRFAEKELEGLLKNTNTVLEYSLRQDLYAIRSCVSEMFKRRNEIRQQMAKLNKQSGGIGKATTIPPEADLVVVKIGE